MWQRTCLVVLLMPFAMHGRAFAMFENYLEMKAPSFLSGNSMYEQRTNRYAFNLYVAGVIDGNARLSPVERGYCLPENGTLAQFGDVFLKYLVDHPETRHHPAAFLTRTALRDAFRCSPS